MATKQNKAVFSRNLQYYVERSGLTQKEICEMTGIATSTLNAWLLGQTIPPVDRIKKIAAFFDVSPDNLISEQTIHDGFEKPTVNDGLSDKQRQLIDLAKTVPASKVDLALKLVQSVMKVD